MLLKFGTGIQVARPPAPTSLTWHDLGSEVLSKSQAKPTNSESRGRQPLTKPTAKRPSDTVITKACSRAMNRKIMFGMMCSFLLHFEQF